MQLTSKNSRPECRIIKLNETSLRVETNDRGILQEISEHFTFFVPGYRFMPAYRSKMWDGKLRIFNLRDATLPYGLCLELCSFLSERDYSFEVDSRIIPTPPSREIQETTFSLTTAKGEPLIPRDYQLRAVNHALREKKSLLISPTASGKSLIIYLALREFLRENPDSRTCIIVPTTQLTEQMVGDFNDYSRHDDSWDNEKECHAIYSGKERDTKHRVIAMTWQTAVKLDRSWFSEFGMVIGDEAHLHKAKSLVEIMSRFVNAEYRIGTTGTLDDTKCHEWVLTGIFGPVYRVTTTKNLIDAGTLAKLQIHMHILKYSDSRKKEFGTKRTYADELDFIVSDQQRMQYLVDLASVQKGNTLILFSFIEKHGKVIYEQITKALASLNRKIFYIHGGVATEERDSVRGIVEKENNAIICASTQCFATGVNIRNLHNLIFAAPSKSQIRVLQSIGRGLRRSDNNQETAVHDLIDDIRYKKSVNYTFKHGQLRHDIYSKQQFPVSIYSHDLL